MSTQKLNKVAASVLGLVMLGGRPPAVLRRKF